MAGGVRAGPEEEARQPDRPSGQSPGVLYHVWQTMGKIWQQSAGRGPEDVERQSTGSRHAGFSGGCTWTQ